MKKTYKYIALAALALGFAACTQDDDFAPQQEDIVKIASANIATEVQTRVNTLDDGTEWENTDRILLVNNSRNNKNSGIYTATITGGSTHWSLNEGLVLYASGTNDFTAYYPAVADEAYTLPTDQSMSEYIKYADRMVATTNGVAKGESVALRFERQHAMITIVPAMANEFTGQSISHLNIEDVIPYHLEGDEDYTAIIAPSEEGFGVTVTVGNQQLTAATSTKIEAGKHYTFNLKVGKDLMEMETVSVAPWNQLRIGDGNAEEIPYLTFTADAEQTMTINTSGSYTLHESLQYSVNGGKWTQLTAGTPITFGDDKGTLRLRGKSSNGTANATDSYAIISFGKSNVQVACSGDIRTLVDYASYATITTANARFCNLFINCKSLTTAPELPATTLATECYSAMFQNCTRLTAAPELPATELAERCYRFMFDNCTSLTAASELPATELATECYSGMFQSCTSLTTAPELPATELATKCYDFMFQNCSNLIAAPALPATELADHCYRQMFQNCSSLIAAPELPATELATECYYSMFRDCTSLTAAPELPATELAERCYYHMFYKCNNLTKAPDLPATELAEGCYYYMFYKCENLTEAPKLPATTLATECYFAMFLNCTSLTTAPELPATTLATKCYTAMFQNCTSLTAAPELPATTLADYCYNEMFKYCANLTTAPELPATTLADYCYKQMFRNCTNLSSITMLATDISATDCLSDWVSGVATAGTLTKAAAATLETGTSGIPEGWTVVDKQ